ncbi:MAG: ABC transporter permease [Verrucomicrobia bacterium]|nr:ABC transporter permease [Verrucomicrobiota bacterium]
MQPDAIGQFYDVLRDARYGVRMLARSPGFTLAATACLGLGVGLATSSFTQFQASIFKYTPGVRAPESLVSFQAPVSFPDFEEYRDHSEQFESVAAFLAPVPFVLTPRDRPPERIWGHIVTPNYFRILGVEAAAGRLLGPEEERPGSTVAVISHRLWTSRFGASRELVGNTVRINGQPVTIAGVAGREFVGTMPMLAVADVWIATTAPARVAPELGGDVLRNHGVKMFQVVGRLKPGTAAAGAEAALDAMARRLEEVQRDPDRHRAGRRVTLLPGGRVYPIREQDLPVVAAFPVVMIGLVLMIACVNVATMLVARSAVRHKEIAIRLSLGASRARLVRQLLTESMLLAASGGAAAVLFVYGHHAILERFVTILPSQMQYEWTVDWRAFVVAFAIAGVSALLFGLAPALQATRVEIAPALKSGSTFVLRRHRWFSLRNVLVVQQMTASLTLLLLTAFVVLGFQRSKGIDLGFEPGNLFLLSVDPVRDGYTPQQAERFFSSLPEHVRRMPGVRKVALTQTSPFGLNAGEAIMATQTEFAGGPKLLQSLHRERVGAGFFETLGVPVLAGRTFRESDQGGNARLAVINQTMAKGTWPGRTALGQTIELDGATHEVIGVVGDIRSGFALERSRPTVYLPAVPGGYAAPSAQGVTVLVRAERGIDIPLLVRREIGILLPDVTVFNVSSMTEQVERMAAIFRMASAIYGGIGLFGLVLAAVGLTGVTAYAVARRTHEIGIRRALGAQNADIMRLVLREGVALIAIGSVLGMAAAFAAVRLLASTLSAMAEITHSSIRDPRVLVGAPLLLIGLAFLACYLPARRSLRIDPVEALRAE